MRSALALLLDMAMARSGAVLLFSSVLWTLATCQDTGPVCRGTGSPPAKSIGLVFCRRFTDNACCTPALDAENGEMFNNLLNVGDSCRARGTASDHPMAEFYCLNCAPQQPQFLVNSTVHICQEWVDNKFGKGNELFTKYRLTACGLSVAGACSGNGDRYSCGDDLIIPSANASSSGGVDIVRTVHALLNYKNIGPPLFEEGYTFSIVSKAALPAGVTACYSAASITQPTLLLAAIALLLVPLLYA